MSTDTARSLLIVEDDLALQKQIKWSMDRFESVTANDRESALVQMRRHNPAVVTMDLGLPPDADSVSEGFKLLEQILAIGPGHQGHRADRPERPGQRAARRGDGRLRLLCQALRARTAELDGRARVPDVRAAEGEPPPARTAPARRAGRPDHARPGDAAHLPHDRAGGQQHRHGHAAGRERHRQGGAGAGAAPGLAAARRQVRGHQLRGHPREPARERAVRLREGRLHRRGEDDARARSRRRTRAR